MDIQSYLLPCLIEIACHESLSSVCVTSDLGSRDESKCLAAVVVVIVSLGCDASSLNLLEPLVQSKLA